MKSWFARIGFALLVLVLAGFIFLASWEPFAARSSAALPERHYRAEIIRDEFGVPHIYGKTDADVAFGVAIAHAEDDFFTLQDVVAMSKGRYGAIAGEEGAAFDYAYHLLDARGTAERHYPELPADTRALFDAYAAGLNQYAAEHPEEAKLGNLFPVDGVDIAAGFALRQPFFFGLGNVIQPLVAGEPLLREYGPDIPGYPRDGSEPESTKSEQANLRHAPLPWGEDGALAGSNAFAVTPEKSGGPSVLISNSHQPWRGGVAWYELVVESEEGWHYAGANFPGSPFPFLGHNEDLGWTNTVNRPDMVDVYELDVSKEVIGNNHRLMYQFGDEWLELESEEVTLPVKIGPVVIPVERMVYRSVHGPVIKNDKGYFAIRYGGIDNLGQLDAYYRLNKAKTLDEWQTQLARMDIPSTNFIYADKAGNIAYVYNAALPDRQAGPNWRGILPGNDPELVWQGTVDFAEVPKIVNPSSGWIYNANNEPYTAAGAADDLDPADFAPELGVELKQTNRSRRAWKLLSEASLLDRKTLERIKYDTAYVREGYVDQLWDQLEALDLSNDDKLAEARDLLLEWDFTADNRGRADALALLMIKEFMSAEYQNKPEPDALEQLETSVDHLMTHFGRIDPPMSQLLRLRQPLGPNAVDLPLDGGSDTLRASTTWDVDEDGRLSVKHGDSFIMWAEWMPGERVSSRSIQPYGAATTRPGSNHYSDQAALFVQHKLKPVHFWREDVLANAKRRYVVESY
ncbi:Penicillin amidase family protein [Altererythrobacter epoxidivorans]|uniref:Penicillin amidase family protein n=1 Tax=Altererythrobacter epoxidivorans TaxID=361183 RepID=A0A0M5L0M9_9SPHN|nr:acylase [Altererythrobacter epoxidivorans]ALE17231.1 Penicillin amidase family protein [Altererythrobacter epoxidivorans]